MRTNFAVYRERIFELPTIMTFIYPFNDDLKLGRDFEIQFKSGSVAWDLDGTNLTLGANQMKDSDLKVNLTEDHFAPNVFRITPLNFVSSMPTDFHFKYIFKKETMMNDFEINVGVGVGTENGTHHCNGKYHDGHVDEFSSSLGQYHDLIVEVEKQVFLQQKGKCRMRPYADMFKENLPQCSAIALHALL